MADMIVDGEFRSLDGQLVQGQEVIVPILKVTDDPNHMECIGTGFYITRTGVLVTAAHVVRDVWDGAADCSNAGLAVFHYSPEGSFLREVRFVALHTRADVAIAATELNNPTTEQPITNKVLTMTTERPAEGASIQTWAYPQIITEVRNNQCSLFVRPKIYTGNIIKEYPEGRDRVLLPGPCYETNMGIEGGASGGPVFDSQGRVVAVNSTGINGDIAAFISHIQSIGGLPVPAGEGQTEQVLISALIKSGQILLR